MLSFEERILSKICGNVKDFLPEDSEKNFLCRIGKHKHWTTFCEIAILPVEHWLAGFHLTLMLHTSCLSSYHVLFRQEKENEQQ